MKWNAQTIKWVLAAFALVAFVSLMLALGDEERTFTIGGDDPTSSSSVDPGGSDASDEIESGDIDEESGLPWIREDEMSPLAQGTLAIIDQGGPYPYERDGITFENREGILPDEDRGYYHEFTVVAPGADNRGPERIVTGDGGEFYWTEDHYQSFERILRRSS